MGSASINPHPMLKAGVFSPHRRAFFAGLLGSILICIAASLPGSPFAFKVPGAWFFGTPPLENGGGIAQATALMLFLELACGFAGIVLLCRAWLSITRMVMYEPGQDPRRLAPILVFWSIPLLVAPPMFSDDIYSYAAQGEMVSHHISPYLYGPGVLGSTPFSSLAQGVWINTPSPYGPLFSRLEGGAVQVAGHHALLSIVVLRLLAVAGVALMAVFVPSLARSYGKDPATAVCLGVLNPLVLLFLIGSGHNDALMLGLLVAGLSVARRGHFTWGVVLCAFAGAIKLPGLAGVLAIAWTSPDFALSLWRRCLKVAKAGLIALATFEGIAAISGMGWGWVHTIGASDTVTSWVTPVDLVAKVVPTIFRVSFLGGAHVVGPVLAIAVSLLALRRISTIGMPLAMGISLLAVVLLGPIVQPWYLMWAIALLAITAGPRTAAAIALLSVSVSVFGVIGLGQVTGELISLGLPYLALILLILTISIAVPIYALPRKESVAVVRNRPSRLSLVRAWTFQRV
jgi:alpha-1,6-mannosyltransferase